MFGINPDGEEVDIHELNHGNQLDEPTEHSEDERDMNDAERDLLKQFQDNDAELEGIAKTIITELEKVKNNALVIEQNIDT